MRQILIYPEVEAQADLDSLMSRLAWYMKPHLHAISSIRLACPDKEMIAAAQLAPHLDPEIAGTLPAIREKVHYHSRLGLNRMISNADPGQDVLLVWDVQAEKSAPAGVKTAIAAFARRGGLYRVDPVRTRQEGSFFLWCGLNRFSDVPALLHENTERMGRMIAEVGHYDRAYVFGTGPSFSDFVETGDFGDALCIAANSIVKNTEALARLNPRIICAADPIYHAGCSSYAAAFRQALLAALESTGAWFLCPMRDLPIYRSFLPAHLLDRVIGVPFDKGKPVPVDLGRDFYINPFPNVLTLMLLPVAATLADTIHVAGCDGRRLLDDSFFWSHDKKVQFSDQMAEIQAAHPGFFDIDYNDYYTEHCQDLEKVLAALEAAGKTVVNETPSLIPALHSRQRQDGETAAEMAELPLTAIAMLDPDAKDDWGHFLAYDKRVATTTQAQGLEFFLICRQELEPRFRPAEASGFLPVFSVHSWTVGNKSPARREDVMQFARELDQALDRIECDTPGRICLFFYVGSIEVAEMLEYLLIERPRISAVINLFWSYAFDQGDPAYRARWYPVLRRLMRHPRIHLTHSTPQIAEEFSRDWGLDIPVLGHPSTTFSDAEARQMAKAPIPSRTGRADQPLRVVFPGGARAEKGFMLALETCDLMRGDPNMHPVLRARLDKTSGQALNLAYGALNKRGIEIIDQDLSDDGFIAMIAEADIIVIPYLSEAFRRRTSGILVDAMLLGKPVVVLEETWLADIVSAEGTGVCAPASAAGLMQAIAQVAAGYDGYAAHIRQARMTYLETNSWAAMLADLSARAGGQARPARAPQPFQPQNQELLDYLLDMGGQMPGAFSDSVIVNSCAAALLLTPAAALERLQADGGLHETIERCLQALPEGDAARVNFQKVRAFASASVTDGQPALAGPVAAAPIFQ